MREPLRSNSRLKTCGKLTCMGNVANSAARKARSIYSRNSVRIVMIVCLRKSRSARCPAGHKVATCSELCLFPRGVFELVFHGHQLALALLQTSAMPLGLGRGHLGLLALERLFLLVHPLVGGLQRRFEVFLLALMMPVGAQDGLATIVDLEPAVGNHAFEAELLNRVALAVHPWPLAHV